MESCKVIIPDNVLIEEHADYNVLVDSLASQAIKRGATIYNNGDWTVTYIIQRKHMTKAIISLVLSAGWDVDHFPLHSTTQWSSNISRTIDWVTWYEHRGKVSEMGIDIETAKTDEEISALI